MNALDQFLLDQKSFSFNDIIGQPSDAIWTPTDASGAGLVLSLAHPTYVRIGKLGIACAVFSYPATADGTNSKIGGFPFVCRDIDDARSVLVAYSTVGTGVYFLMDRGFNTGAFYKLDGTNYTNANLSGKTFVIQAMVFI